MRIDRFTVSHYLAPRIRTVASLIAIYSTGIRGKQLGYNIVVVRNLVRGTNEDEEVALKIVSLDLGMVVESGDAR